MPPSNAVSAIIAASGLVALESLTNSTPPRGRHQLQPVRRRGELAQGAVAVGQGDADRLGGQRGRESVLEVVLATDARMLPVDPVGLVAREPLAAAAPGQVGCAQDRVVAR